MTEIDWEKFDKILMQEMRTLYKPVGFAYAGYAIDERSQPVFKKQTSAGWPESPRSHPQNTHRRNLLVPGSPRR